MIGDVKARIVRSDGEELTLGDGLWRIPNDGLENWANLPYNVFSAEIPSQDGAIITSKRVSAVDRTITAQAPSGDREGLRAEAIRFFNPRYTFKVFLTYMGRTRWCEGEQIGFKASEWNIYKPVEITWTILCPNPFLRSEDNFGQDIAETVPMFMFPWWSFLPPQEVEEEDWEDDGEEREQTEKLPAQVNEGAIVSYYRFQRSLELFNDGDVPSGLRIELRALGDVTNPAVRLGDGWVRLLATLHSDDVAVLDVTTQPPTVEINGKSAMHLVDRNSSILNLRIGIGETTLEYEADDGYQNLSVSVYWNKQFLGV